MFEQSVRRRHPAGTAPPGATAAGRPHLLLLLLLLVVMTTVLGAVASSDRASAADPVVDVSLGYANAYAWSPSIGGAMVNVLGGGPGDATGVTLTFTVPAGAAVPRGELTSNAGTWSVACTPSGDLRSITCAAPQLVTSAHAIVTVVNTGLPPGSTIPVSVTANAVGTDPNPADNAMVLALLLPGGPVALDAVDVGVAAAYQPPPGNSLARASFGVSHTGVQPATNLTFSFTTPSGVVAVLTAGPSTATCSGAEPSGTLTCTMPSYEQRGNIPTGFTVTAINVGLPAGSTVDMTASVTHDAPDQDPTNDTVHVPLTFAGGPVPTVAGTPTAALSVHPVFEPRIDPTWMTARFGWYVTNSGPWDLDAVELTLEVDPAIAPIAGTVHGMGMDTPLCTFVFTGSRGTCTVDELGVAPGGHLVVGLDGTFTAGPGTVLVAALTVSSPTPADPYAGDDRSVAQGSVPLPAPPATTPPDSTATTLPSTGSTVAPMLAAAAAALVLGGTLRRAARRQGPAGEDPTG